MKQSSPSKMPPPPKVDDSVNSDDDDGDEDLRGIKELDDEDIDELGKLSASGATLTKEQKLTQRMQRKAESARVARLRKKEYVTGLEDQIKELTEALKKAQQANGAKSEGGTAAAASSTPSKDLSEEGMRQLSHMDALLRQPNLDRLEVNATVERFVANKRAQQTSVNEFLDCIEDILSPAAPLQVAFNESGADESFVNSAAAAASAEAGASSGNGGSAGNGEEQTATAKRERDEGADGDEGAGEKRQRRESVGSQLMSTLQKELGLNSSQVDGLSAQKEAIRKDREIVADCMRQIKSLRARVAAHIQSSQRTTDELRRILEPAQVARFLLWVERNQRSMHKLNSIVATE